MICIATRNQSLIIAFPWMSGTPWNQLGLGQIEEKLLVQFVCFISLFPLIMFQ